MSNTRPLSYKFKLGQFIKAGEDVKALVQDAELRRMIDETQALVSEYYNDNETPLPVRDGDQRRDLAKEILLDSAEHDAQPVSVAVLTSRFHEAGLTAEDMNEAAGWPWWDSKIKIVHIEGVCHWDLRRFGLKAVARKERK